MSVATPVSPTDRDSRSTPTDLGVGARFTLAVMSDDFADIILSAIAGADASDLEIETGSVSTVVRGSEQRVLEYVCATIASAARGGHHVTASLLLTRGCPGEVTCATTPGLLAQGGGGSDPAAHRHSRCCALVPVPAG